MQTSARREEHYIMAMCKVATWSTALSRVCMSQEDFNQEFQRVKALRRAEADRLADAGARMAEINAERTRLGAPIRPEDLAGSGPIASDPDHEAVLEVQVRSSLQPAVDSGLGIAGGWSSHLCLHTQVGLFSAPLAKQVQSLLELLQTCA